MNFDIEWVEQLDPRLQGLVKQAAATVDPEAPDTTWGLVVRGAETKRMLPLCSAEQTLASAQYLHDKADEFPPDIFKVASKRVQASLNAFGLSAEEVDAPGPYVDAWTEAPRIEAARAEHYALGDRYPLDTVPHVQEAQAYFAKYASYFRPEDRHTYASNVARRAKEVGVNVKPEIAKYAGARLSPNWKRAIRDRARLANSTEASLALEKIAEHVHTVPAAEVARALTRFDRHAKLDAYWGSKLDDPYASCLTYEKENQSSQVVKGRPEFGPRFIAQLAADGRYLRTVREALGDRIADRIVEDPEGFLDQASPRVRALVERMGMQMIGSGRA